MFTNAYVKEVYDSEHVHTTAKQLHVILYNKYENSYLHKVIKTQCIHLTITQRNKLLRLLQKSEEFFDKTLGTWKTDPVDCQSEEDAKPI